MKPIPFVPFCEDVLGVTFEPGQRVFWQVAADDVEPGSLEGDERDIARQLFGDIETVPAEARHEVALVKGADVGFSYFGGLRLLHRALTATELGAKGEIRPALGVAPDLRVGRIPVRNALGAAEDIPKIAKLIETKSADGFVIRRDAGRRTSVETLPASVGGRALRSRRYVEVLFDEGAFFRDANYAVNDVDCKNAVISRCLGKFWSGSTPWLETSDVWQTYQRNFGGPVDALAVRMPTLLVRTDPRVVRIVEQRRIADPVGAATEFDCEPPMGRATFLDSASVMACAHDALPLVQPTTFAPEIGAIDLGFVSDSTGGAFVRQSGAVFEVTEVFERKPSKGHPLVPSHVMREFCALAKKRGVKACIADQHYFESAREVFTSEGITLIAAPGGNTGKETTHTTFRELVHSARVRWSASHRQITLQARELTSKPLPGGGIAILSPRRVGAGHGDVLSAVVLAVWAAHRSAVAGASNFRAVGPMEGGRGWSTSGVGGVQDGFGARSGRSWR